jgi:hypothetical protein
MIRVTAHAIARAMERIPGLKSEAQALALLKSAAVTAAVDFAPRGSIYIRLASGNRIAVEDGNVVTVLPKETWLCTLGREPNRNEGE